ncbi:hypothetical protein AEAC466_06160 [Asticcacaulis sp. AC466]|uniref:hypothetical protein n=1 Tax=Asticcacaulis sp. AC466 TaxID=1282362 RepID=UPI0003C40357|nr:hypothetical protein [Asticcacaulis sp. AC466]ESQ84633.1 hypothetical protein AEAC466_06160 [Asticcacaulis sp. AC466]
MSRLKAELARKKFPKLKANIGEVLSAADPESFCQLVWAVWGLQQSEPVRRAAEIISYPVEAMTNAIDSRWAIQPWEIETLMNLHFEAGRDLRRRLDSHDQFGLIGELCNRLRKLEDVESATYLDETSVLMELHRIAHRQFSWQRGFVNRADFYRYFYLYGIGNCAAFFDDYYGLSVEQFTKAGFALLALFSQRPLATKPLDFSAIGLNKATAERAASLMTISHAETGDAFQALLKNLDAEMQPIAYRPSLLRRKPIIAYGRHGTNLRAPLPPLIMLRVSGGMYYDLQPGGGAIRDEVARQFENYVRRFIATVMPRFNVEGEYRYNRPGLGTPVDSPDAIVLDRGRVAAVIECKATKLTFSAQYAGDPAVAASDKYDELAKGVFQLWRFFSHCRRGLTRHQIDDATHALLLTVDSWLSMSRNLQVHVLDRAKVKAKNEPGIELQDQKPIIFASIQYFERVLLQADEDLFLGTLAIARTEKFTGWLLPDIKKELRDDVEEKPYPFDPGEIIPWWDELNVESRRAQKGV